MDYSEQKIKVLRFEEANGFYTTPERSKLMSKIKGKDTKPEILFRKELWKAGIRYRKHDKSLPGNPDITNKKLKLVIFIDGEFWHGYNWEEKKVKLKSNRDFWISKIERNMQKDRENNIKLENLGYKIFRFWDHEIKKDIEKCISLVNEYLETKIG
ncbi:very short patch repair endonuclease [Flavobacterium sharifuzzamanii]|uniref:very short patch repair endonuclease n=1 Tax=Flavobacterium sharifuzzamanii TaxID=2211133 RepID=UPI000DAD1760|nr:very short patch repair endonuclease [Flavobacterium sharifuzzamanii]KAF2079432.1 very short patch repair endonuclease [Flavobacterium sharifuzzamanii]